MITYINSNTLYQWVQICFGLIMRFLLLYKNILKYYCIIPQIAAYTARRPSVIKSQGPLELVETSSERTALSEVASATSR